MCVCIKNTRSSEDGFIRSQIIRHERFRFLYQTITKVMLICDTESSELYSFSKWNEKKKRENFSYSITFSNVFSENCVS